MTVPPKHAIGDLVAMFIREDYSKQEPEIIAGIITHMYEDWAHGWIYVVDFGPKAGWLENASFSELEITNHKRILKNV